MGIIVKKQYFADKELRSMVVPADTVRVEEWAFAFCPALKEIRIPRGCVVADKAFQGTESLERIRIYDRNDAANDVNTAQELLALSVLSWPASTGTAIERAADDRLFLSWFDGKMTEFLQEEDGRDFSPFLAGGEEDYGDEKQEMESYVLTKKKRKVRLVLERLSLGDMPSAENGPEKLYLEYLKANNPEIPFTLMRELTDRRAVYEDLYFQYRLQDHCEYDTLMRCAGADVELRSRILRNSSIPDSL